MTTLQEMMDDAHADGVNDGKIETLVSLVRKGHLDAGVAAAEAGVPVERMTELVAGVAGEA